MNWNIREITPNDYETLAQFNSNFDSGERSKEDWIARFKHWWDNNPAFCDGWIRGYILLYNNLVVGAVASFPTYMLLDGKVIRVFNGTSWRVLNEYRKWSMDLWLRNRDFSDSYISFNTTPADNIIPLIKQFGYIAIPDFGNYISFYILDLRKLLISYSFILVKVFLPLINKMCLIIQRLHIHLPKTKFITQIINNDDPRIDLLWNKTKDIYNFTNVRNLEYMKWIGKNRKIISIEQDNELIGFSILTEIKSEKYKYQELSMDDLWFNPNFRVEDVLSSIIKFTIQYAKENKISLIKFPHLNGEIANSYKKIGLFQKKHSYNYFIKMPKHSSLDSLSKRFFSMLQGDYGV